MIKKISTYMAGTLENPTRAVSKSAGEEKAAINGVSSDRVQISQDYREMVEAQKSLLAPGDIRTEKVEQVRNRIDSGAYRIQPEKIAGRMLDEII